MFHFGGPVNGKVWNFFTWGGTFIPWNFHSLELSFPGTFILNIKISMELSFFNIDY